MSEQVCHRTLADLAGTEGPADDLGHRHTVVTDDMGLPGASGTEQPEAVDHGRQAGECLDIVVSGYGDDLDSGIEKPLRAGFQRDHGLESGIVAVDHVAGQENGSDPPVDRQVDAAFKGSRRRQVRRIDTPVHDGIGDA